MASRAPIAEGASFMRPSAERRSIIRFPGGHVMRINHEHLAVVLATKAVIGEDFHTSPDQMRRALGR